MRLIDHYHQDIAGMDSKERHSARVRWHAAVKRALILLGWTSDPAPVAYTERGVQVDVWSKDPKTPRYQVRTHPVMRFFLQRDRVELAEVYRATKRPRTANDSASDLRIRDAIEATPEYHATKPRR